MIRGSLDLTTIQVEQATAVFQQALLLHQLWSGPLPVCLAEHHQGKARRLRLVLATLSHLTKAEISSLQDGPRLPGDTTVHGLVYCGRCVAHAGRLVITDGQQSGRWRLLHNSTGPGQRCSVDCSQRYQPTLNAAEQRKAQDYTFEALHCVYFYDAWRAQPVLDALGSELVLPLQAGLLVHGCFWPQGDCLSNRPASSNTRPASNDMLEENGEETSALPPRQKQVLAGLSPKSSGSQVRHPNRHIHIHMRSPRQGESEPHGSLVGLGLLSNREFFCPCSQC